MSEQEQIHADMVDEIISKKMVPVYWMMALMITIFVTVSVPLTLVLITTVEKVSTKADAKEVSEKFDTADKSYLQKFEYYQIEADEHRMVQQALKYPENAAYIFEQINDNIAGSLGFKYTARGK